jgi:hypothetical protein
LKNKFKLLFVVCLVSIAVTLSAGKAHAISFAGAAAQLKTTGPQGEFINDWSKSFSVALAGTDAPVIDGPFVDWDWGMSSTRATALIPGPTLFPPRAVGDAITNGLIIPSINYRGVIQSLSLAVPVVPDTAFAFSAAGYFGGFEADITNSTLNGNGHSISISAIDLVLLGLGTHVIGQDAAGFAIAGVFMKNLSGGFSLDFDLVRDVVSDGDHSFLFDFSGGPREPLFAYETFEDGDYGMWGAFVATGVYAEPIPEPATIALLGIGLAGLAGAEVRRRRKKKVVDNS